jgi:pimeloyl-ACP methyl ester carboxylesterase
MYTERRVTGTGGVQLAVYEAGAAAGPVIVCIHGFPDNHRVWDGVVDRLAHRYRVVSYDVRGAGASDKPPAREAYRLARLEDDFAALIDAVSPDRPVHLLAHDWGSIQAWHFATSDSLRHRIASLTSISGPDLDQAGHWLRTNLRNPRTIARAVRQLACSSYIAVFQLPVLPEQIMRTSVVERILAAGERLGRASDALVPPYERSVADRTNGIQLYRANMFSRLSRPVVRTTDIPVQVLAPAADLFVSAPLQHEAPRNFATDLRVRTIAGGHWGIRDRPQVVARLTVEFVDRVEGTPDPG